MSSEGLQRRWQVAIRYSELSPMSRLAAWTIATWTNPDATRPIFAGTETLLEATGMSRAQLFRSLKELREQGWIRREKTPGKGHPFEMFLTIPESIQPRLDGMKGSLSETRKSHTETQESHHAPRQSQSETRESRARHETVSVRDQRFREVTTEKGSAPDDGADPSDHVDPWTERGISFGDWLRELREQARKARLDGAIGAPDLTEAAG